MLATSDAVGRAKILAEDFPAGWLPSDDIASALAFWGSLTPPTGHPLGTSPITGYWIRTKEGPFLMQFPSDGRSRMPSYVGWGQSKASKHLVLAFREPNLTPPRLTLEVYHVLSGSGKVITDGSGYCTGEQVLQFDHELLTTAELGDSPVLPYAVRFGRAFGVAFSDVPYRVDKNGGANTWLTVVVASRTLIITDGEYDLPGGTPSGWYDLRTACQNGTDSTGQAPTYPTPAQYQSQFQPASSDVGCFRWEPHPTLSGFFRVFSYTYSINPSTAPPGAPLQTGSGSSVHSTWDAINTTPVSQTRTLLGKINDVSNVNEPIGGNTLAALYDDLTEKFVWVIRPSFVAGNNFWYKYACDMTTYLQDMSTRADAGHLYLPESPRARCDGVLVYFDQSVIYNDLPVGLTGWTRLSEETWPSFGGIFEATAPAFTRTWRAPFFLQGANNSVIGAQGDTARIIPEAYVDANGDFWVMVTNKLYGEVEVYHMASAINEWSFSVPGGLVTRRAVVRKDSGGKLWISGIHIIGTAR